MMCSVSRKKCYLQFSFVTSCCLFFKPWILLASPQVRDVESGSVRFDQKDPTHLQIVTSDKAIINYESFNIAKNETVTFIQPKSSSCVLNRVQGKDLSSLMGSLQANGKVFLINPNGIIVGPSATINTGSFIASTLDVSSEHFLNEHYEFILGSGAENSTIVNYGNIACPEGAIALLAPHIQNEGVILAKAGKIVLAAGEKVLLDFTGDGLINFSVEGALKEAVINNLGVLEASGGEVCLKLRVADETIKRIVNSDGLEEASHLIEEHGEIRLVDKSYIAARSITVDGDKSSRLTISGEVKAKTGGTVQILGEHIDLLGAHIDASGDLHGGSVWIGGDYKGEGTLYRAQSTRIDQYSTIYADALSQGDGGSVIVWSDHTTCFDGQIYARGKGQEGQGGFVETSGKHHLSVRTGYVDASAPFLGRPGQWLLDPLSIVIDAAGLGTLIGASNCVDAVTALTIAPATINASPAGQNVILCASGTITQNATQNISMTNNNAGIIFQAGGVITLNGNITTRSGDLTFMNNVALAGNSVLDTTNTTAGANVTFTNIGTLDGTFDLSVTAGVGSIRADGVIGGTTALGALTLTGNGGVTLNGIGGAGAGATTVAVTSTAGMLLNGGTYRNSAAQTYTGDVTLGANTTMTSTGAGSAISVTGAMDSDGTARSLAITSTNGAISLSGAIGTKSTLTTLTLDAGTSAIGIESVGNVTAGTTGALSLTGSGGITLNGAVYHTGGTQTYSNPVTLGASTSLQTTNAAITFASTINATSSGTQALTISAGTGTLTMGAVGATTVLNSVKVINSGTITANGSITTLGDQFYSSSIILGGDIAFTTGDPPFTTGESPITFKGSVNATVAGAQSFTASAGFGAVSLVFQSIGNITPVKSVTLTGDGGIWVQNITTSAAGGGTGAISFSSLAGIFLTGNAYTTAGATGSFTATGDVSLGSASVTVTTSGAPVTFTGAIDGDTSTNRSLTVNSSNGAIQLNGAIGTKRSLNAITLNAGTSTIAIDNVGNVTAGTTGALSLTGSGGITLNGAVYHTGGTQTYSNPVTLGASTSLQTTNAAITFASTINATSSGTQALTISAGTGTLLMNAVGATTSLNSVKVTNSGTITANGSITTTGDQFYNAGITLGGDITFTTTNNSPVTFKGNVNATSAGGQSLTVSAGFGAVSLVFLNIGNVTPVKAVTITGSGGIWVQNITTSTAGGGTGAISLTSLAGIFLTGSAYTTASAAGSFTATGEVTLGTGVTVTTSGAPVTFAGAIDGDGNGNRSLTVNSNNGVIQLNGAIGTKLSLNALTLNAGTSTIAIENVGNVASGTAGALSLTAGGGITLNGSVYRTTGTQTYSSPVTLGTSTLLQTTNAVISFSNTVNGTSSGLQSLLINSGTATTTFANTVGASTSLNSVNVIASGGLTFTGNVTTRDGQSYTGAATLAANSTFTTTNAPVSFSSTIDGAFTHTVAAGNGSVFVGGAIGATSALGALTLTGNGGVTLSGIGGAGAGATTVDVTSIAGMILNGGTYSNSAAQTYTGDVTLGANTTMTSTGAGSAISVTGTTDSDGTARSLSITSTNGAISLNGAIGTKSALTTLTLDAGTNTIGIEGIGNATAGATGALSLTGSGGITLNGAVYRTGGTQTYSNPVILGVSTSLQTTNAAITFASTINGISSGNQALTINSGTGALTFNAIGTTTSLNSIKVIDSGTMTVNGSVTTAGDQFYSDAITLGGDITFTTTNDSPITFKGPVNATAAGVQSFTASAGFGAVSLVFQSIGNVTPVKSVTITGNGGIWVHTITTSTAGGGTGVVSLTSLAGIFLSGSSYTTAGTTGSFTAAGPVALGTGTVTVTTSGAPVTFRGAIDGDTGGARSLVVNSNNGAIQLNGSIGTKLALNTLTLNAGTSTIAIDNVGNVDPGSLGAFSLTGSGGITLNGTAYHTGGTQTYASLVTLGTSASLQTTNAAINFANTVNGISSGLQGLLINSGTAATTFASTVGETTSLNSLNVIASGGVTFTGNVTTRDSQSYTGAATLAANSAFTTTNAPVSFSSTINGDGIATRNLNVSAGEGSVFVGGAIGSNLTPFGNVSLAGTGGMTLNGIGTGIQAIGDVIVSSLAGIVMKQGTYNARSHSYTGPTTLAAITTVTSAPGQNVTFMDSIDGDGILLRNLTISAPGAVASVNGVIGGNVALGTLSVAATDITVFGMGMSLPGISGTTSLTALHDINFQGSTYLANNATYTAGNLLHIFESIPTHFNSFSGPINFMGSVNLVGPVASLVLSTNNADINIPSVIGTSTGNVLMTSGTGSVSFGDAPEPLFMSVTILAGKILLTGPITGDSITLISSTDVFNNALPVTLTAANTILINAEGGAIGTALSPINVNAPTGIVLAGATQTAHFTGVTNDHTIHCLPANPPPLVCFNGSCVACSPSPLPLSLIPAAPIIPVASLFVAGMYSNYVVHLASDFIFLQDRAASGYGTYTVVNRLRESDVRMIYSGMFAKTL